MFDLFTMARHGSANPPELEGEPVQNRETRVEGLTPIYLAVAYRWGETNNHWYFIYAGIDRIKALAAARNEVSFRGGKYGTCVWEFTVDGLDYKRCAYYPSSAEPEDAADPTHNHMNDYFHSLGIFLHEAAQGRALLPSAERRMTYQEVTIPDYQRMKVDDEQRQLKRMNEAQAYERQRVIR
jgi:hypothetical protein